MVPKHNNKTTIHESSLGEEIVISYKHQKGQRHERTPSHRVYSIFILAALTTLMLVHTTNAFTTFPHCIHNGATGAAGWRTTKTTSLKTITTSLFYEAEGSKSNNHFSKKKIRSSPRNNKEMNIVEKLKSYETNIGRLRRAHRTSHHQSLDKKKKSPDVIIPCRSLVYFLQSSPQENDPLFLISNNNKQEVQKSLNRACIQAIRAASECHNYLLIFKLVENAISFSRSLNTKLEPRVFGEAISGIHQTKIANVSKLKRMWNLFLDSREVLTKEPSAYELNVILKAYGERGKIKMALNLYRECCDGGVEETEGEGNVNIVGDSYTASILFGMLADSIPDKLSSLPSSVSKEKEQKGNESSSPKHEIIAYASPCWQWRETLILLNEFEQNHHHHANPKNSKNEILNNHVYAAVLQVNEKASSLYNVEQMRRLKEEERGNEGNLLTGASGKKRKIMYHRGATAAVAVLERMRKQGICPDVITCTSVMSALDKGKQWKAALALLSAMEKANVVDNDNNSNIGMEGEEHKENDIMPLSSSFLFQEIHESDQNEDKKTKTAAVLENDENKKWSFPSPNVYTYASAISSCARCNKVDEALSILDRMGSGRVDGNGDCSSSAAATAAVLPNTWVYNAAMAACVGGGGNPSSLSSLSKNYRRSRQENEVKRTDGSNYNRLDTVLALLNRMEEDAQLRGTDTLPDTITYNTALSAIDDCNEKEDQWTMSKPLEISSDSKPLSPISTKSRAEKVVIDLLARMKKNDIPPDGVTYHNAIMACKADPHAALRILHMSLADSTYLNSFSSSSRRKRKGMVTISTAKNDRASEGLIFNINAALSACATAGDMASVSKVLVTMRERGVRPNAATYKHIIRTLGNSGDCDSVLILLQCLQGDTDSNQEILEKYNIDVLGDAKKLKLSTIVLEEQHYAAAISACLQNEKLTLAERALQSMKNYGGLNPSETSLREFVLAYCQLAMQSAGQEFKTARKLVCRKKRKSLGRLDLKQHMSSSRAHAAFTMSRLLSNPPTWLLSKLAQACSAAGLWDDARTVLRSMHRSVIRQVQAKKTSDSIIELLDERDFLAELPELHRSLLKLCARAGNVTAALWFVDDIQHLSSQFARLNRKTKATKDDKSATLVSEYLLAESTSATVHELQRNVSSDSLVTTSNTIKHTALSINIDGIGMDAEDWKLLMIAASKSGHWKLCIAALQFLRPFVERTHPQCAFGERNFKHTRVAEKVHSKQHLEEIPSLEHLNTQYEKIARALTAAVLCFEIRSQYAWAIRSIDDWIEWSGRRPRKEAVIATCRILATRGRGQEVYGLVMRVLKVPELTTEKAHDKAAAEELESSYEHTLYREAITALYKNGLYDNADDLYAVAVADGYLPWAVLDEESSLTKDKHQLKLDLHGMTTAIAHSAVRVALQKEIQTASWKSSLTEGTESDELWDQDLVIVTGKGRKSLQHLRPVLRPEVQRMLQEEFYPPLSTTSIPGNIGALRVPADDVKAWLAFQRQQKGVRLLAVADVLRGISSGSRLKKSLSRVNVNKSEDTPSPTDEKDPTRTNDDNT